MSAYGLLTAGLLPSLFLLAAVTATASREPAVRAQSPKTKTVRAAVLSADETVIGRARRGRDIVMLTAGKRLIAIAPDGVVSSQLDMPDLSDRVWGLAYSGDGELWTLEGRDALRSLPAAGQTARRLRLDGAYVGVHSGPGYLLYQPYDFRVGSALLYRGAAGEVGARVGTLTVAADAGPRLAAWVKSLVQCSVVHEGRTACWPAGAALVDLIDASGRGVLLRLAELTPARPMGGEEFAASGRPLLQDVWLADAASFWVLANDQSMRSDGDRGATELWKFSTAGKLLSRHRLPQRARMLLASDAAGVLVLGAEGDLVRVEVP